MSSAVDAPTVLVTAVGGIIGQGLLRSLRAAGQPLRVLGLDREPDCPFAAWCDGFHAKPGLAEEDGAYLQWWLELLDREGIGLVLPGHDADVEFLDRNRAALCAAGLQLALDRSDLLQLCRDKFTLGQALAPHGIDVIPAVLPTTMASAVAQLGAPPLVIKPRRGSGSRGVVVVRDAQDFDYWVPRTQDPMIQRLVGTDTEEYTVGVFGFGDGTAHGPLVFRRRLGPSGATREAVAVDDPVVEAASARLTALLSPSGPCNYQFRKCGGKAWLLEVNPRFSSSNSLRTAFGFNEAAMAVDWFLRGVRPAAPHLRKGISWRYSEDIVRHVGDPF